MEDTRQIYEKIQKTEKTNGYGICRSNNLLLWMVDCKLRFPKYFTHEAWINIRKLDSIKQIGDKEFFRDVQEELCKRFDIIITNYLTPKERRKIKWQKRFKEFKLFLSKFKSKNMSDMCISWNDIFGEPNNRSTKSRPVKQRDLSFLLGNSKSKKRDLDFITGKNKKKNMDFLLGNSKTRKKNMDFITGNNSRDYSSLLTKPRGKRKHS